MVVVVIVTLTSDPRLQVAAMVLQEACSQSVEEQLVPLVLFASASLVSLPRHSYRVMW